MEVKYFQLFWSHSNEEEMLRRKYTLNQTLQLIQVQEKVKKMDAFGYP